jgi:hypothetical protein
MSGFAFMFYFSAGVVYFAVICTIIGLIKHIKEIRSEV